MKFGWVAVVALPVAMFFPWYLVTNAHKINFLSLKVACEGEGGCQNGILSRFNIYWGTSGMGVTIPHGCITDSCRATLDDIEQYSVIPNIPETKTEYLGGFKSLCTVRFGKPYDCPVCDHCGDAKVGWEPLEVPMPPNCDFKIQKNTIPSQEGANLAGHNQEKMAELLQMVVDVDKKRSNFYTNYIVSGLLMNLGINQEEVFLVNAAIKARRNGLVNQEEALNMAMDNAKNLPEEVQNNIRRDKIFDQATWDFIEKNEVTIDELMTAQ